MAEVTGNVKDFRPEPLGTTAVMIFRPMNPSTTAAGSVLATKEIRTSPDSAGAFDLELAAYTSTNPNTAYRLTIEWFSPGVPYPLTDEIPWPIVVPLGGGLLVDMFADVQAGALITKGDKGDDGTLLQQTAIDDLVAKDVVHDTRLTASEAKNTAQDATLADHGPRIAAAETKNLTQDGRLSAAEGVSAEHSGTLTAHAGRLTAAETKNLTQDESITAAKAKNALQDERLTVLETVAPKASNIALDTDGTPYFSPGANDVYVMPDSDGVPFYFQFLTASADTDGTPYF